MQEINIQIKPSKLFITLLMIVAVGSLIIVFCLPLTVWIRALLLFAVFLYGTHIFWRYALLRQATSIVGLRLNESGWQIQDHHNAYPATLLGDSTVTRMVCVLRFQLAGHLFKRSCLVWRDSLESNLYRKLTVMAKWVRP